MRGSRLANVRQKRGTAKAGWALNAAAVRLHLLFCVFRLWDAYGNLNITALADKMAQSPCVRQRITERFPGLRHGLCVFCVKFSRQHSNLPINFIVAHTPHLFQYPFFVHRLLLSIWRSLPPAVNTIALAGKLYAKHPQCPMFTVSNVHRAPGLRHGLCKHFSRRPM